jgi:hypothetical protein
MDRSVCSEPSTSFRSSSIVATDAPQSTESPTDVPTYAPQVRSTSAPTVAPTIAPIITMTTAAPTSTSYTVTLTPTVPDIASSTAGPTLAPQSENSRSGINKTVDGTKTNTDDDETSTCKDESTSDSNIHKADPNREPQTQPPAQPTTDQLASQDLPLHLVTLIIGITMLIMAFTILYRYLLYHHYTSWVIDDDDDDGKLLAEKRNIGTPRFPRTVAFSTADPDNQDVDRTAHLTDSSSSSSSCSRSNSSCSSQEPEDDAVAACLDPLLYDLEEPSSSLSPAYNFL